MSGDQNDRASASGLWEAARNLLRWLYAMCGSPRTLVAETHLSRQDRRRILFWLRPLEALVRRLLVVEAARIAGTLPPAAQGRRKAAARSGRIPPCRRTPCQEPDDSAAWKVTFSPLPRSAVSPAPGVPERLLPKVRNWDTHADVLAPARLALDARQFHLHRQETFVLSAPPQESPEPPRGPGSPWRLARRIEALTRVLENPVPYARRLARRLNRDAARIVRTLSPPPERPPGTRLRHGDEPLRLAHEQAVCALAPFDTS